MTTKLSNPKDIVGVRKAPMSTVSAAVMAEVGVAMLEGAAKYGRHNYRAVGVRASVYYDSTMRHLMTWWEGEDTDIDSGMSHVTKAITSLVVLRDAMIQGKCEDDRPPKSADFYTQLNAKSSQIIEKYSDCDPVHYTEKLIGDTAPPVPHGGVTNADGWIKWDGGECPVEDGPTYEIEFGDGERRFDSEPSAYDWSAEPGYSRDNCVIAYRIHKAGE